MYVFDARVFGKVAGAWVGVIAVTIAVAWHVLGGLPSGRLLLMASLDVGQGDSMVLRMPHGQVAVIDAGLGNRVLAPLERVLGSDERRIDLVVLTHLDRDHAEGFLALAERYTIGRLMVTGAVHGTELEKAIYAMAEKKNIPIWFGYADLDVALDDHVVMDIIWPTRSLVGVCVAKACAGSGKSDGAGKGGGAAAATNDTAIVVRILVGDATNARDILLHGHVVMLTTADISSLVEAQLVRGATSLRSDILKVPHHGSKYSSSSAFLRAVRPRYAFISVGARNMYHHPHPDALKRLAAIGGIRVLRTDQSGTLTATVDPLDFDTLNVRTDRP